MDKNLRFKSFSFLKLYFLIKNLLSYETETFIFVSETCLTSISQVIAISSSYVTILIK